MSQVTELEVQMGKYIVRKINQDDEEWLLESLERFEAEADYGIKIMDPDPTAVKALIRWTAKYHLFLIADEIVMDEGDGAGPMSNRVGFVSGILSPCPFNHKILTFHEVLWWVDPQYRGRRSVAALLMDEAIEWAKDRGANWIWWSNQVGMTGTASGLKARGFEQREIRYLLEVN